MVVAPGGLLIVMGCVRAGVCAMAGVVGARQAGRQAG